MWIKPIWPALPWVVAGVSTCIGGVSKQTYASLNLAAHVQDNPAHVAENRSRLLRYMGLPREPAWLNQVHGYRVTDLSDPSHSLTADAAFTTESNQVCVVLTADCLPMLICDELGQVVAAVHAGWRGLLNGLLENTLAALPCKAHRVMVWFGPAIGAEQYPVGCDVKHRFQAKEPEMAGYFTPARRQGTYTADLYAIARHRLQRLGVTRVFGAEYCTHRDAHWFYSHRRTGLCGRFASFIYLNAALRS